MANPKKFTDEEILVALKRYEAGESVAQICEEMSVSGATFYKWKLKHGVPNREVEYERQPWKWADIRAWQVLVTVLIILFLVVIVGKMQESERKLISWSMIPLLAGLVFQAKRLFKKWSALLEQLQWCFLFSFLAFLPGKNEHEYIFETHIQMWPYVFIGMFSLYTMIVHMEKVTHRLTEGITLLHSLAVIYWVVDLHLYQDQAWYTQSLMGIGLLLALFSLGNALTPMRLSKASRLVLSVWSTLITLILAGDNIYKTYEYEAMENPEIWDRLQIGLQFFLLGVSTVYIVRNLYLIISFLPGKDIASTREYLEDVQILKEEHLERYSEKQVSFIHSFFCLAITATFFFLNFQYQWVPRNLAIWTVFAFFPFIIHLFDMAISKQYRIDFKMGRNTG